MNGCESAEKSGRRQRSVNIDWNRPDRIKGTNEAQKLEKVLTYVICAGIADSRTEAMKYVRSKVPPESRYQERIMKYIRQWATERGVPCIIWKQAQGAYSRGGVSDVLALCGGVLLAVEVKRPFWGNVSKLQKKFIDDVNRCGGVAGVAVYPEDLQPLLEKLAARAERTEK